MIQSGTLQVLYDERIVGHLALTPERKIAFEYSEEWLETGFSIDNAKRYFEKYSFRTAS